MTRPDKLKLHDALDAVEDAITHLTILDDEDLVEDLLHTISTLEDIQADIMLAIDRAEHDYSL